MRATHSHESCDAAHCHTKMLMPVYGMAFKIIRKLETGEILSLNAPRPCCESRTGGFSET